ncbi:unnamed protein product [Prorocentrum cordatum]|uniref:Peptidase S9 prolyl oligopeptidase catalytic domain-containing protein n=1 Tax=Prorocentrum cordatum TaxID=2364126 RepID=A0ABN9XY46_9DINO|nr:unnamed protein product [Polarella glacialis]
MAVRWALEERRAVAGVDAASGPPPVAVVGSGFGGYAALQALLEHPDLFACGVAIGPTQSLAEWPRSYAPDAAARLGGVRAPAERWEELRDAPLLLVEYERDADGALFERMAPQGSDPREWPSALQYVQYVGDRLGGGGSRQSALDQYRRIDAFLFKHLSAIAGREALLREPFTYEVPFLAGCLFPQKAKGALSTHGRVTEGVIEELFKQRFPDDPDLPSLLKETPQKTAGDGFGDRRSAGVPRTKRRRPGRRSALVAPASRMSVGEDGLIQITLSFPEPPEDLHVILTKVYLHVRAQGLGFTLLLPRKPVPGKEMRSYKLPDSSSWQIEVQGDPRVGAIENFNVWAASGRDDAVLRSLRPSDVSEAPLAPLEAEAAAVGPAPSRANRGHGGAGGVLDASSAPSPDPRVLPTWVRFNFSVAQCTEFSRVFGWRSEAPRQAEMAVHRVAGLGESAGSQLDVQRLRDHHGSTPPGGAMPHRQHGYGQRQGRGGHHQQAQAPRSSCKRCGHWEFDHKLPGLEWRCSCGAMRRKKGKDKKGKGTDKGDELAKSLADVAARIQARAFPPEATASFAAAVSSVSQAVQPQAPQNSPASLLADAAWRREEANMAYDEPLSAREEAHERPKKADQTLGQRAAMTVTARAFLCRRWCPPVGAGQCLLSFHQRAAAARRRVEFAATVRVREYSRELDGPRGCAVPADGSLVSLRLGRLKGRREAPLAAPRGALLPIEDVAYVPSRDRVRLLRRSMGDHRFHVAWARGRWEMARDRRLRDERRADAGERTLMPRPEDAHERAVRLAEEVGARRGWRRDCRLWGACGRRSPQGPQTASLVS